MLCIMIKLELECHSTGVIKTLLMLFSTSQDSSNHPIRSNASHLDDPFYWLVYGRDLQVLDRQLSWSDWKGDTLLSSLATIGNEEQISRILSDNSNNNEEINHLNAFGQSPLFLAARWGHHRAVQVLLEHGADPHCAAESYSHTTPLMAAASCGKVEVLRTILKWLLVKEGIEEVRKALQETDHNMNWTCIVGAARWGEASLGLMFCLRLCPGIHTSFLAEQLGLAARWARRGKHHALSKALISSVPTVSPGGSDSTKIEALKSIRSPVDGTVVETFGCPKTISVALYAYRRHSVVNWALKKSFFGHYCAGVTEYEPMAVATELRRYNIGSIFALCAEGEPTDLTQPPVYDLKDISTYNIIKERTLGTVNLAGTAASMTEKWGKWEEGLAAVKLSGLAPMSVLERLSEICLLYQREHEGAYPSSLSDYFEYATNNQTTQLTDHQLAHAQRFTDRVDRICYRGSDMSVRVIIEAEWTAIQPFFDFLAMEMMKKYNNLSKKVPTVYKTYQAYLQGSEGKVDADLQLSLNKGFRLGCVVTKGDYHAIEHSRATATGRADFCVARPSPMNRNVDDTDIAFERMTRTLLFNEGCPHFIIASHEDSLIDSVI
ncbi:hypothetical protein FOL47_009705, partial [Perkinsus chesapeaki]